jgi:hypothetical protein
MRLVKNLLALAAIAFLLPVAHTQMPTVTAASIVDISASRMAGGTICIIGTDENNNPTPFRLGTNHQAQPQQVCRNIVNGVIAAALQFADPAQTQTQGIGLQADHTADLQAATKQYADGRFTGVSPDEASGLAVAGTPAPRDTATGNATISSLICDSATDNTSVMQSAVNSNSSVRFVADGSSNCMVGTVTVPSGRSVIVDAPLVSKYGALVDPTDYNRNKTPGGVYPSHYPMFMVGSGTGTGPTVSNVTIATGPSGYLVNQYHEAIEVFGYASNQINYYAQDITISVKIKGTGVGQDFSGVFVTGCDGCKIVDSAISAVSKVPTATQYMYGHGIEVQFSRNIVIERNSVALSGADGVFMDTVMYAGISNNILMRNNMSGLQVVGSGIGKGGGYGGYRYPTQHVTVSHNISSENSADGIDMANTGSSGA